MAAMNNNAAGQTVRPCQLFTAGDPGRMILPAHMADWLHHVATVSQQAGLVTGECTGAFHVMQMRCSARALASGVCIRYGFRIDLHAECGRHAQTRGATGAFGFNAIFANPHDRMQNSKNSRGRAPAAAESEPLHAWRSRLGWRIVMIP